MLNNLSKETFNEQLNRYSTRELENLVQKFPYFHQAQVLLARKYQLENHPKFDEQLQMAALYVQDRELFYELFHTPAAEQIENQEPAISIPTEIFTPEINTKQEILEAFPTAEVKVIEPVESTKGPIITAVETAEETASPEEKPQEEPVITAAKDEEISAPPQETTIQEVQEQVTASENEPVTAEQQVAAFSLIEPHTFDEWLHAFAKRDKETAAAPLAEDEKTMQQDEELDRLIAANATVDYLHELVKEETHYSKGLDKFIEKQIQKHKTAEPVKNVAEIEIDPAFVTETLATLYEKQRKYPKAIKAYEALSLKFPEKSDLFAARIQYLKNCIDL